jgi:RES domain
MIPTAPLEADIWRLLDEALITTPMAPARAPSGRFHHSGQLAIYASLSPAGAELAMRRYAADGIRRILVPLRLMTNRAADIRGVAALADWQDFIRRGETPPTWPLSDAAIQLGAEAMVYSSRSSPRLSHVVVFEPRCLTPLGGSLAHNG